MLIPAPLREEGRDPGMETSSINVFIGIDVGKSDHWATALTRDGKKLFDKALPNTALPNDEACLHDLYKHLGSHGRVLMVVDQYATIGALAVA